MAREFFVEVSEETYLYLEAKALRNAERGRGPATVSAVATDRLDYARMREETLARDRIKEAALRASGPQAGVTRRRYQPRQPDAAISAPETPADVREWATNAPVAHPEKKRIP